MEEIEYQKFERLNRIFTADFFGAFDKIEKENKNDLFRYFDNVYRVWYYSALFKELSAIRKHTVGDGQMSPMDALIYVSDFIEPGREPFPGLEKARKLAEKDIYRAMVCCTQLTAKHLKSQGKHVHPRSQALLDHYDK